MSSYLSLQSEKRCLQAFDVPCAEHFLKDTLLELLITLKEGRSILILLLSLF